MIFLHSRRIVPCIDFRVARRASAWLLVFAACFGSTRSVGAADYTWTQSGTSGPYDWTTAGNWSASGQFVSSATNALIFFADTTTALSGSGGSTDITTNVPATLTLNALTLNGRGPSSGVGATQTVTIGSTASTWTFGGASPSINLSGSNGNRNLLYNVAANLAFNASTTIAGNGNASFTLSGSLTGGSSVTLTKQGSSTLLLGGTNTGFSGNWVIASGILQLNNGGAAAPASLFQVNSGATLRVNNSGSIAGLTDNAGSGGSITNASGGAKTLSIAGSGTYAFAGTFSGSTNGSKVSLAVTGPGTQFLSGSNVGNVGTMTVSGTGGTLVFSNTNAIFQGLAGAVVTSGSTQASLSVSANATAALGVGNAASGYFDAAAIATFLDATHMGLSSNSAGFRNASILGFDTTNAGGTFTYGPALTDIGTSTGIGFAKLGTGTLILTGTNTYTGPTQIRGGTLEIGGAGQIASSGTYAGAIGNAGVLAFTTSAAQTISGVVSGAGSLVKTGNAVLTLSNTTNGWSGGTTLNGGSLVVSSQSLGSGAVTIGGTAVQLKMNGPTNGTATLANAVTIGSVTGFTGQGVIDTSTGLNAILTGTITIAGTPANGGHFGASSSGSLTINGPINAEAVPVVQARSRVVYAGGGNYAAFTLGGGTAALGAGNGLSTAAAVTFSGSGVALDLAGFSQSLVGITRNGATPASIGNSSTTADSTLTLTGTSTYSGAILDAIGAGTRKVSLSVNGGSLTLTGTNTYTGSTTVRSGVLAIGNVGAVQATSGVNLAAGGRLRYQGGSATFDRNITVTAASGTGVLENTGGGTLTLTGTLAKDGSVLRFAGGSFAVAGPITGASPNSDVVYGGTSSVLLTAAGEYNGPTSIVESATVTLGVANAISGLSTLQVGDASTVGTLVAGTFSNSLAGLSFGAAGGTLRIAAASSSAAQLSAGGGTISLTNGTLDLAGSGTTAGLYRLLGAQSVSGSFAGMTGVNAAYRVVTTATSVDYQQKAVLGGLSVANPAAAIITGGSAAFTYTLANAALEGGATLAFSGSGLSGVAGSSVGAASAAGSSGAVPGLVFTGTTVGAGQTGTFTVDAPTAFGPTTATGTVSVTVLDHATSSLGASLLTSTTISLGTWNYASQTWESGANVGLFSIHNLSSYGAGLTAPLSLVSVSGTADGFTTNLDTYADIVGGSSRQYEILVDPTRWNTAGLQTATFTLQMSDNAGLSGATATNPLSVTAAVVIVPEPGTLCGVGFGVALAAWWTARTRSPRRRA